MIMGRTGWQCPSQDIGCQGEIGNRVYPLSVLLSLPFSVILLACLFPFLSLFSLSLFSPDSRCILHDPTNFGFGVVVVYVARHRIGGLRPSMNYSVT